MNLRTLCFSIGALSLALLLGNAHASQAATLTTGSLIKASGPAVYYFSENGKRYAFPDTATYASWYSDFNNVQTLTDSELASVPFGGVVTIRPGSRMVKIQTDPRVYAVARGGVLRWVRTEALAQALYGMSWNRQVSDVPDAFFTNYRIQGEVTQASDFSVSDEQSAGVSIDADLRARGTTPTSTIPTTPTSTPTTPTSTPVTPTSTTPVATTTQASLEGRVEILSAGPYRPGDVITILGTVTRGQADLIRLVYGTSSTLIGACSTSPCRADFTIPDARATTTIQLNAVLLQGAGTSTVSVTSTKEFEVMANRVSSEIHITSQARVSYGSFRLIRVDVDPSLSARSIKIMIDGVMQNQCDRTQYCESYLNEASPVGTVHSIYAAILDWDYHTVYSPISTLEVVQ